jgi:hypothetical protein
METLFPIDLLDAFDPKHGSGVVAVVGSGPSCHAGLPSWQELLRRVAVEVDLEAEVDKYLVNREFLKVAQFLSRQRSEREIQERVAKQVDLSGQNPSQLHRLIVNLPFAGIITTNYDLLLSKADANHNFKPPITHLNSNLRNNSTGRFILHLHGHVGDPESIIISRQGYDYMELKAERVRQFLAGVFQFRSVLFIGFGFSDDHIDDLLRKLKDTGAVGESTVFALIPSPALADRVLHDNLRFRSVNPIYLADNGDYGVNELEVWLETLSRGLAQIASSQAGSVKAVKPKYVIEKIESLLVLEESLGRFGEALGMLPNRPDLQHAVRSNLRPLDVPRILERLDSEEMRLVLVSLNKARHDEVIEDVLTCFPPRRN